MSIGTTPALSPGNAKRSVPRYKLAVPLDLTVLRAGIPNNIHGRTLEIGEGGMGVAVASELLPGESVRVEFLLPHMASPVRATAVVRYRHARGFGLQFLHLPVEQQSIIRYWTRCECDLLVDDRRPQAALASATLREDELIPAPLRDLEGAENPKPWFRIPPIAAFAVLVTAVVALLGWWRWQQEWAALEARLPAREIVAVKPQVKVPADVMHDRIRHQVMPEYPEDARQSGVQGTVVLDAVVSPEGTVTDVKRVSGPEALAPAAINAVRWWRYEPYLVDGQPATVETTLAVDFRLTR